MQVYYIACHSVSCYPERFPNCTSIRWNSQLRSGFHRMSVRPGMAVVYACFFCPSTPTGCVFRSGTPCSWSPIDEVIKELMHDCVIKIINRATDTKRDYCPHLEEQKIWICLAGFCASTTGKYFIPHSKIKWLLIEYLFLNIQLIIWVSKKIFSWIIFVVFYASINACFRWKIVCTNRDFSIT